jgi:GH25 family lysozyme M1 (1,4-beta-N-acetylmuramidase)
MTTRPVPQDLIAAQAGWPNLLHFIDISKWQAGVDYGAARGAVRAAVIKASGVDSRSGVLHIDSRAAEHSRGFASVPQGFYHYARQQHAGRPSPGGAEQAAYFMARVVEIVAQSGVTPRLLALDLEEVKEALTVLTRAQLSAWVRDFMRSLASNPWGALPVIYTSASELRPAGEALDWLRSDPSFDLWIAGYPSAPRWPAEGPAQPLAWPSAWGAWQWTSKALTPGFKSGIDANIARPGSRIERALRGGGGASSARCTLCLPALASAAPSSVALALAALALAAWLLRRRIARAARPLLRRLAR